MNESCEKMREKKDFDLKQMACDRESDRQRFEATINEKSEIIKRLTQELLSHEAVILELQTNLEKKADIED